MMLSTTPDTHLCTQQDTYHDDTPLEYGDWTPADVGFGDKLEEDQLLAGSTDDWMDAIQEDACVDLLRTRFERSAISDLE